VTPHICCSYKHYNIKISVGVWREPLLSQRKPAEPRLPSASEVFNKNKSFPKFSAFDFYFLKYALENICQNMHITNSNGTHLNERMRNKSLIDDLLKMSFKNPAIGFVMSIIFTVIGFFLKHRSAPTDLKPSAIMLLPTYNFLGTLLYFLALLIFIVSAVGFIRSLATRAFNKDTVTASPPPKSRIRNFKTKEEYFKWKESQLKKSSNANQVDSLNESARDDLESVEEKKGIDLSIETLKKIEWYSFEILCKLYYENIGYTVFKTKAGADGGMDLLLYESDSELPCALIQCKSRTHRDIGISYMRELLGVMTSENVNKGIFITNSSFTREAFEFAKSHQIEAIDVSTLWMMLDGLVADKKSNLIHFLESSDFTTPTCPNCEVKLEERIAKKGKDIGQKFWGCKNYPRCRYTFPMNKPDGQQANSADAE